MILLAAPTAAHAASLTVTPGQTVTTRTSIGGTDAVVVDPGGNISVASGAALSWDSSATGAGVTVLNNGVITGGASAVGFFGAPTGNIAITNTGTLQSQFGLGINLRNTTGNETVTNSGVIQGGYGIAVLLGNGTDTFNTTTSASTTGRVVAPSGTGAINLSGAGSGILYGASEGVNVDSSSPNFGKASGFAGWDGFSTVNVNSGTWTIAGGGYFSQLNIASGATLITGATISTPNGTPNDGGIGPQADAPLASEFANAGASTLAIVNNGTFVIEGGGTALFYDPAAPVPISYSGSGQVQFAGSRIHFITPNETFVAPGGTSVSNSTLEVLGNLSSNVTVNPGASLQIGGGGLTIPDPALAAGNFTDSGFTGNVTGNVTDNGTVILARLDDYTLTGALTGNGILIKDGPGALSLGSSTNFAGHITLAAGTLNNAGTLFSSGVVRATSSAISAATGAPGPLAVNNTGTIQSKFGIAIDFFAASATAAETVTNSGAIDGGYGIAILLGGGADTVNLTTSASIIGRIVATSGTGTINLSGGGSAILYGASEGVDLDSTSLTFGVASGFAGWDGFSTVNVNNGTWTLAGGGYYSQLNIASGATLITGATISTPNGTPNDSGLGPQADGPRASALANAGASTLALVNNGTLLVEGNGTSLFYDPAAPVPISYSGSGQVQFAGSGVHFITPNETFVVPGGTSVSNSSLEVLGNLSSDVTVNPGASLQIGGGGLIIADPTLAGGNFTDSGLTGNVSGNVIDNGTVIFNRLDSYTFAGAFSGNGVLIKDGPGVLTFEGPYSFIGATLINGGTIDIAQLVGNTIQLDSGTLNLTGNLSVIADLTGIGGTINVASGDTLSVGSGNFGGNITGGGALTKTGAGTLALGGIDTLDGPTEVAGGTLQVDGALTSPVTVDDGATLGGTGLITGSVTLASGGTFSPGDPVTTTIHGALTFMGGSKYLAQVTPVASDLIAVTGPVIVQPGAVVEVEPLGNATSYARLSNFTIVTATGGVSGTFSSVTSDMPLLTPHLTYTADTVDLSLTRNDIRFASLAITRNQAVAAAAIEAGGFGSPLYLALVAQDTSGARQGYDALSGELFATLPTILLAQSDQSRRTLMDRLEQPSDQRGMWGAATGSWGSFGGFAGVAGAHDSLGGATIGVDHTFSGWRLGAAGSYTRDDVNLSQGRGSANDQAEAVSLYAGGPAGPFAMRLGGTYAWHNIETNRSEVFAGFSDHSRARLDAGTGEVFGEVGYSTNLGGATLEPFVGVSYDEVRNQRAAESGGPAALAVEGVSRQVISSRLGLRAAVDLHPGVDLHGSVAWRHASDDANGTARVAFEDTGQGFTVSGQPIAEDAVEINAGLSASIGARGRIDASYSGQIAAHWTDNAVKLLVAWDF